MAELTGPAFPGSPLFVLDGTMYPVDHSFDWSADVDVLMDALRHTYIATRMHHWATLSPDREWLACACVDPAEHRDQLIAGWGSMAAQVRVLRPNWVATPSLNRRLPIGMVFFRAVQVIVIGLLALAPTFVDTAQACADSVC